MKPSKEHMVVNHSVSSHLLQSYRTKLLVWLWSPLHDTSWRVWGQDWLTDTQDIFIPTWRHMPSLPASMKDTGLVSTEREPADASSCHMFHVCRLLTFCYCYLHGSRVFRLRTFNYTRGVSGLGFNCTWIDAAQLPPDDRMGLRSMPKRSRGDWNFLWAPQSARLGGGLQTQPGRPIKGREVEKCPGLDSVATGSNERGGKKEEIKGIEKQLGSLVSSLWGSG